MSLYSATTFGELLKQLRKRAGLTQRELAAAVGYSLPFISNLELNQRLPDVQAVVQSFIPALGLQDEPRLAAALIEQAALARGEQPPPASTFQHTIQTVAKAKQVTNGAYLPALPTQLLGRDAEVTQLCNRLLGHQGRLLTLVGPPGVGKTRLALAVATHLQTIYPDGVYFVPFAPISDPALVASELTSAMTIADSPHKPPEKRLFEFLRRKELLLLLDNFEQISAAAPLVASLLAECPGVRILVTSRERLHLRAEQRYPVQPLDIASACELFVQRAQAVEPTFRLTAENQSTIAAICQHLDCLPLALELSAVQIDLFSPQELLARLQDHRLDVLANGLRDLPAHHQTLRQAIARSYDLLPEREQALFRTLGVFVGGFDLAAITYLGFSEKELQSLINKSLVQLVMQQERGRRFILLETLRTFANEILYATPESQKIQQCHAQYFLELAENAYQQWGHSACYEQLEREYDNLRAALSWSLAENSIIALQLVGALREFWCVRGYYAEGGKWVTQALRQNAALPSLVRGRALHAAGTFALIQADYGQATVSFDEALQIYSHWKNAEGIATSLNFLGIVARDQNDLHRAKRLFEQSLTLRQLTGDTDQVAGTLGNLAFIALAQGDSLQAKALLEEALAIACAVKNERRIATLLTRLSDYDLQQNAPNAALARLRESLLMALTAGYRGAIMFCLERIAEIIGLYGEGREDKERSVHLLGAADALRKKLNTPLSPLYHITYQRTLSLLHAQLDEDRFAEAWAAGQALALEEAVQCALTCDFGLPQVRTLNSTAATTCA